MWNRCSKDISLMSNNWRLMCSRIPFTLGTDCKSLYDLCTKNGSMPEEKRVALDLLDVRESIEECGDKIRWIPTDHMLVDCMTKAMPPDAMMNYLKTTEYAFKYDDVIKNTKRELSKTRKKILQEYADTPLIPANESFIVDCQSLGYRAAYLKRIDQIFYKFDSVKIQ